MARRRIIAVVKIQIPAGQATPAPPVGTALGPHGVAIMEFCKQYNAATESQRGMVVPVEVTVFDDRSFTFVTKTPPTPNLLRAAAGIPKGAKNTGVEKVGRVSKAHSKDRRTRPTQTKDSKRPSCSGARPAQGITVDAWNHLINTGRRPPHFPRTIGEPSPWRSKSQREAFQVRPRHQYPASERCLGTSLSNRKFDDSVTSSPCSASPPKADQMAGPGRVPAVPAKRYWSRGSPMATGQPREVSWRRWSRRRLVARSRAGSRRRRAIARPISCSRCKFSRSAPVPDAHPKPGTSPHVAKPSPISRAAMSNTAPTVRHVHVPIVRQLDISDCRKLPVIDDSNGQAVVIQGQVPEESRRLVDDGPWRQSRHHHGQRHLLAADCRPWEQPFIR